MDNLTLFSPKAEAMLSAFPMEKEDILEVASIAVHFTRFSRPNRDIEENSPPGGEFPPPSPFKYFGGGDFPTPPPESIIKEGGKSPPLTPTQKKKKIYCQE